MYVYIHNPTIYRPIIRPTIYMDRSLLVKL